MFPPFSISHSLIVVSSLLEAITFESSRHDTSVIIPVCPRRLKNSRPVNASHTNSPPLRSPVASSTPSALYSTAVTQSVCFLISRSTLPSAVEYTRTSFDGPPTAICVWSAEMSAARMASVSPPTSSTFSPVCTLNSTALPLCPPRPPATSTNCALRENFTLLICPCSNGSTPTSWPWSVL